MLSRTGLVLLLSACLGSWCSPAAAGGDAERPARKPEPQHASRGPGRVRNLFWEEGMAARERQRRAAASRIPNRIRFSPEPPAASPTAVRN